MVRRALEAQVTPRRIARRGTSGRSPGWRTEAHASLSRRNAHRSRKKPQIAADYRGRGAAPGSRLPHGKSRPFAGQARVKLPPGPSPPRGAPMAQDGPQRPAAALGSRVTRGRVHLGPALGVGVGVEVEVERCTEVPRHPRRPGRARAVRRRASPLIGVAPISAVEALSRGSLELPQIPALQDPIPEPSGARCGALTAAWRRPQPCRRTAGIQGRSATEPSNRGQREHEVPHHPHRSRRLRLRQRDPRGPWRARGAGTMTPVLPHRPGDLPTSARLPQRTRTTGPRTSAPTASRKTLGLALSR